MLKQVFFQIREILYKQIYEQPYIVFLDLKFLRGGMFLMFIQSGFEKIFLSPNICQNYSQISNRY